MNRDTQDTIILTLLQKYIDNQCSEQELRLLFDWLKSADSYREFDFVSESLWRKIDEKTVYPDNAQQAELNREVNVLLNRIKREQKVSVRSRPVAGVKWIYRVAAVLALAVGLATGIFLMRENLPSEITYMEKNVPSGETMEYIFSDGTRVILNSGSRLVIPSDYNKENRIVEMDGEGYFDVTPDPHRPFIIKSGDAQIQVLGTSFNVKTYAEDDFIGLAVSSGKVLVNVSGLDLQLRVTPREHLLINKVDGSLSKQFFEENNYIKWMEGTLFFDKEPIREVIKAINRKYSRQVILQCKNKKCDFIISGMHDNKSIEAVVDAICFTTGLKHKEEGNYIILHE